MAVLSMAKINRLLVGESLVGDCNEVAHIDLVIGPRGGPVETAFAKLRETSVWTGRNTLATGTDRAMIVIEKWHVRNS